MQGNYLLTKHPSQSQKKNLLPLLTNILTDERQKQLAKQLTKIDLSLSSISVTNFTPYVKNSNGHEYGHIFTSTINQRGSFQIKHLINDQTIIARGFPFLKDNQQKLAKVKLPHKALTIEVELGSRKNSPSLLKSKSSKYMDMLQFETNLNKEDVEREGYLQNYFMKRDLSYAKYKLRKDKEVMREKLLIERQEQKDFLNPEFENSMKFALRSLKRKMRIKTEENSPKKVTFIKNQDFNCLESLKKNKSHHTMVQKEKAQEKPGLMEMLLPYMQEDGKNKCVASWAPPSNNLNLTGLFSYICKNNTCLIKNYMIMPSVMSAKFFQCLIKHIGEREKAVIYCLYLVTNMATFHRHFHQSGWIVANREVGNCVRIEFKQSKVDL